MSLGFANWLSWTVATLAGLALRSAAIRWNLALPSYREGRDGI